ncbi:MAG TPA: alpha/beta hydrolase-fold protein, partial [Thermoanaerobaculia bacterium]
MEFLWFGKFGRPVILFPTSAGRYFENEDFHLAGSLADKVNAGEIQLVLPDTVNNESWYNKSVHPAVRAARHAQYDAYLRNELVPYTFNRAQRGDLTVYGASFGAYHAANFAARYPDVVSRAVCFSGVFDITSFTDGYWDENCYFHSPTAYISNM